ncbi:MAG: hypothetical protein RLZZ502_1668 [Pseudomonadota bacterium]
MSTDTELFQQAFALEAKGEHAKAQHIYHTILRALPEHPGALLKLAEYAHAHKRTQEALSLLLRAQTQAHKQGFSAPEINLLLADVYLILGQHAQALDLYNLHPEHARAAINRMVCLARMAQHTEAVAAGKYATEHHPEIAEAWRFYTGLLSEQKAHLECQRSLNRALSHHPHDPPLRLLAAKNALLLGQYQQAVKQLHGQPFDAPHDAETLAVLGSIRLGLRQAGPAIAALEGALSLGIRSAEHHDHLGQAYLLLPEQSGLPQAIAAFENALAIQPALTPAWANLINARRELLDWQGAEQAWQSLPKNRQDKRFSPFVALNLPITATEIKTIIEDFPKPAIVALPPVCWAHTVPKIAYLSCDLHDHATLRLMVALFELHRFEVHVYSHGPVTNDALQQRARCATQHWHEVADWSDDEIAQHMRAAEIDILVDLKGHTYGARLGVMAHRPAPMQLHYLGYPASLCAPGVDYFIADELTVPVEHEGHFAEKILRLPRCYQINDHLRPVPDVGARHITREQLGLDESHLLLASFNQAYKLEQDLLDIWLQALKHHAHARLWLYLANDAAKQKITQLARAHGVNAQIIFASRKNNIDHLNRLSAADLVLDSFQIGAHTTASDALWAGVPILTCLGDRFSARVAASVVQAAQLPDFIANSKAQYAEKLQHFCAHAAELVRAREHLQRHRHSLPLFDSQAFVNDYESLLNVRLHQICKCS